MNIGTIMKNKYGDLMIVTGVRIIKNGVGYNAIDLDCETELSFNDRDILIHSIGTGVVSYEFINDIN